MNTQEIKVGDYIEGKEKWDNREKPHPMRIIVSEIQSILIPSEKAVKNKVKANPIIIKHKDMQNIISYSVEIEEYIKNNLNVNIEYYDKYSKAIK